MHGRDGGADPSSGMRLPNDAAMERVRQDKLREVKGWT